MEDIHGNMMTANLNLQSEEIQFFYRTDRVQVYDLQEEDQAGFEKENFLFDENPFRSKELPLSLV